MDIKIIQELEKFIRKSIALDYSDEKTKRKLSEEYDEEFFDFSDHFQAEMKKERYSKLLQKFDYFGPLIFEKFKIKPESDTWDDPDFSRVFYYFSEIFRNNDDFLDLCRVFLYSINSLSAHINADDCNYTIEDLAERGRLNLILEFCEDALIYLWENDTEYFHDRLEEHIAYCEQNYPERIEVFKGTELYESWIEDRRS